MSTELKLGKMTIRELSTWFGLQPDTLTNNPKSKARKLEILKSYAQYHFEGKNLYIDKILFPTYSKAFKIIEKEFDNTWGKIIEPDTQQVNPVLKKMRIDSCARVGQTIWYKNKEVQSQIKIKTAQTYTNKVKVERYGRNYINELGSKGYCERVWMNRDETAPLEPENLKILDECASIAYSDKTKVFAKIDDDYKNGNLSLEEYKEAKGNVNTLDSYDLFVELVIERLGFMPVKRTRLVDGYSCLNDLS